MGQPTLMKRSIAELIGTYVLVFLGTGAVVTTVLLFQGWEPYPDNAFNVGIGMPAWGGIGLSFVIPVMSLVYALGHISRPHITPAVRLALWITRRFPSTDMIAYILAQSI